MNDDDEPSEDVFDEEDSDDEADPGSVSDIRASCLPGRHNKSREYLRDDI